MISFNRRDSTIIILTAKSFTSRSKLRFEYGIKDSKTTF